jgi:hypothetical protein
MISKKYPNIKFMNSLLLSVFILFLVLYPHNDIFSQGNNVKIISDASGQKIQVDGKDIMINGMNWDYIPIGTNFSYSLWNQTDEFIRQALDNEMQLLKNMGVNAIRVYTGIPPKWIQYIYEKYGIYTMLNHSFGRYGLTLGGAWISNTEYSDPRVRELLLKEVTEMVNEFKNTPGLLLYLLGNENNYGLFWDGAETEDIPLEDRKSTIRARSMYKLFNEATQKMKEIDQSHPIAMCNGDLLFIDIIAEECEDIDIFGTNMYRGLSFRDAFQVVKEKLNKPILFTEFGADAFNAVDNEEDQASQTKYLLANWQEIYENAYGMGEGNSIGGFTFQFSDGWWKFGQTSNLDVHDNNASWSNGGYRDDFAEGENNMNEEWFGICAKGPTNYRGIYHLYPRAAYYALKEAHSLNPYDNVMSVDKIKAHFSKILVMEAVLQARGDKAALGEEKTSAIRVSGLRAEFTTYYTGGDLITTPEQPSDDYNDYPNAQGFDYMQSFYTSVEAQPSDGLRASVSLNILGHVAENPIDEIFYENRGRPKDVLTESGELQLTSIERVKVYKASINWQSKLFGVDAFFRTGHYHWGYEGDFFGLYPEANYGPNLDIYNGNAPFGFEVHGKKSLDGLKIAFGPELWWGANPAFLIKYSRDIGPIEVTGIYHEDIAKQSDAVSSFAIPVPKTRRVTLHLATDIGAFGLEIGGIWAGQPRVGEIFQI